jgi:SpoVK/Ycf46/Vps4 family AAA+-type ATPase
VIARDLALAGAAAAVLERQSDAFEPTRPFPDAGGDFAALGSRMRAWFASESPTIERLVRRLGLREAGVWTVLLCAASERFPEVAAAFSILAEDERLHLPTPVAVARLVSTAMGVAYETVLQEAIPGSDVERLRLCEILPNGARPLSHAPLRLTREESRVQLAGEAPLRESSTLSFEREPPASGTAFSRERVALLGALVEGGAVTLLRGTRRAARQMALDLGSLCGEEVAFLTVEDALPDVDEVARMRQGLRVIDLTSFLEGRSLARQFTQALEAKAQRTLLLVPPNAHSLGVPALEVPEFGTDVAQEVWSLATNGHECARTLAQKYRLCLEEARVAVSAAETKRRLADERSLVTLVSEEVLAEGARKMGRSIASLPPGPTLDDLVVPESLDQSLRDMVTAFHARSSRSPLLAKFERSLFGRGVSALFSGPPGTGKTFAARCLATSLGLNLYRIDLSQVVSKYIGETEKALSRVFEEAEAGHGILLFDEADALFGKRSEVKDAHDRYANVEVAYLLQRMESFDGLSILTTNLRNNLDSAFIRRLRFVLEFPVPERSAREALWRQCLPDEKHWAPDLDVVALAGAFGLSGGDIYNVAVSSTSLAVENGRLSMSHVVQAAYRELEKVGLPRTRDDFGALARYLPEDAR